ncbi:hypothetical protein TNCT1_63110 [Streptomyces sp. 1-11]|nr:hypothetical protein TNCT1_63110 [Streptomyces sp. 1-11]
MGLRRRGQPAGRGAAGRLSGDAGRQGIVSYALPELLAGDRPGPRAPPHTGSDAGPRAPPGIGSDPLTWVFDGRSIGRARDVDTRRWLPIINACPSLRSVFEIPTICFLIAASAVPGARRIPILSDTQKER